MSLSRQFHWINFNLYHKLIQPLIYLIQMNHENPSIIIVITTMSLSRQFHWINLNLYQLLQHMWPDATLARMSAPRAERTR